MEQIQLSGRAVLCHLSDDRFKNESLSVHYLLPTKVATCAELYLLPSVLRDGCSAYPDEFTIARRLNGLYGADITHRVVQRGSCTEVVFSLDCFSDTYTLHGEKVWEDAVSLLFRIIDEPFLENGVFSGNYTEREKKLLCDEVLEQYNRKDAYARMLSKRSMCGGSEYGHPITGTRSQVRRVTPESLMREYRRLTACSSVQVFYIGARSTDEVLHQLPRGFFSAGQKPAPTVGYPVHILPTSPRYLYRKTGSKQSHVVLGYMSDISPRDMSWRYLSLFMQVLSDSPLAKLFRNVREATSICYSCNALYESFGGLLYVTAGVEAGSERRVSAMMMRAVRDIQCGYISPDELDAAKKSALANLITLPDRQDLFEMWLSTQLYLGQSCSIEEYLDFIRGATAQSIAEFASHLHLSSHVTMRGTGGGADA